MKTLLMMFGGLSITITLVLTALFLMDMYQRLDERGLIDQWVDRKLGKGCKHEDHNKHIAK